MIDVAALRDWAFPEVRQDYTPRDVIMYGLAVGCGMDPDDRADLQFVYEKSLVALPTMAVTLAHPGFWLAHPRFGVDAKRAVHGEQMCVFHSPLPTSGVVVSTVRVVEVSDKGQSKGASVVSERTLRDASSNAPIATMQQTVLCRGDGGFPAGVSSFSKDDRVRPQRATDVAALGRGPDHVTEVHTSPQSALLYRLSADPNPLHVDPDVASAAGFPRPILHGLCTYGAAARGLMRALDLQPNTLKSLQVRFSAPVYPGETLQIEAWTEESRVFFRCTAKERAVQVLSNGVAEFDLAGGFASSWFGASE